MQSQSVFSYVNILKNVITFNILNALGIKWANTFSENCSNLRRLGAPNSVWWLPLKRQRGKWDPIKKKYTGVSVNQLCFIITLIEIWTKLCQNDKCYMAGYKSTGVVIKLAVYYTECNWDHSIHIKECYLTKVIEVKRVSDCNQTNQISIKHNYLLPKEF
jgi:hypothetical protein